ncbi:MATE family efflux transporter [Haloplasma contractile]|uniref:Probable multidrug resistance protein NorM n=1 Tax=Haloplasma contractile SSD-17B TaxID=1033810 RepID=U2DYK8_9MOLU|nr:MATE family efflux transporter [Haloplasma contractile]ERJ13337.1 phosphonopyruvate decarboxylase protein [Haloplasma contractile SSD-17B]
MKKTSYDLTRGNITKGLLAVATPVILTSFAQMFYNMTDIIFLGKFSKEAVSSAGLGGFYVWMAAAVFLLGKIGTEIKVSQSIGKDNYDLARSYARSGVQLQIILSILYGAVVYVMAKELIDFFKVEDTTVIENAIIYLRYMSIGFIFYCLNPVLSGAMNGTGKTVAPFVISASGLLFNIVLDYILIIRLGYGVEGAAFATVVSQGLVTLIFLIYFTYNKYSILHKAKILTHIEPDKMYTILKLGTIVAIHSALFTAISMWVSRIVSGYGADAIAVQKVGSQIESLSWRTASGIQTALAAFVGQNYGAKRYKRIVRGYRSAMTFMGIYGLIITVGMFVFAAPLFNLFMDYKETTRMGVDYLQILAASQVFMIIEMTTAGAFNGLSKTSPPAIISIVFNALRIPGAIILTWYMGLNGIWLAISISSVFKGVLLLTWFILYLKRKRHEWDREEEEAHQEEMSIEEAYFGETIKV